MQTIDGRLIYSATDLVGFLECAHLADLNRAVAEGHLAAPVVDDPVLDRIAQRGIEHEQRFLASLRASEDPLAVEDLAPDRELPSHVRLERGRDATLEAMRRGVDVIYQATLYDGRRQGYADFLRRVETPSALGAWSYEVWDTKLARHAKASALLQLCMYSEMVADLQGFAPEQMHLALGGVEAETASFRVADYAAYYRSVVRELEAHLSASETSFPVTSEPAPTSHCDVCRWSQRCNTFWHDRDDLSLVANLTSRQRTGLIAVDLPTRTALADAQLPLAEPPRGVSADALFRVHEQARVQVEGERLGAPYFERIDPPRDREGVLKPNVGLGMLPAPSEGDLFFDIEGDPFFGSTEVDGIDYLFGVIEPGERDASDAPRFHAFWAIEDGPTGPQVTPAAERRAFEAFIDLVQERLERDPGLHIYHYAPYETTAVKRLAMRYATREAEVDELLRGRVFVDLYRAVRQGIRAAVESYSIKKLEQFYGYQRDINLRSAGDSIVEFETWLELGEGDAASEERARVLQEIEDYNRDDCVSTLRLRDWLEEQRAALVADLPDGDVLLRPHEVVPEDREASEKQKATMALVEQLTASVPDTRLEQSPEQHARWLLAQMLSWHAREDKAAWWRYYYLKNELTDEERREESDAIGELEFVDSWPDPAPRARSSFFEYRFPPQEYKFRVGEDAYNPDTDKRAGMISEIEDGRVVLRASKMEQHPTSLIPRDIVNTVPKPQALERIAKHVLEDGIGGEGSFRVARDLLLHSAPRFISGTLAAAPGESNEDVARREVLRLDSSYLAVQGPPGSGKTTVGGKMIADLVAAKQRVGVTATSHKVIGNLLDEAAAYAAKAGVPMIIGQRPGSKNAAPTHTGARNLTSASDAATSLHSGAVQVVGGTAWLWADEAMQDSVDVLFIDEAGQMSLADALAASPAARSLVLLGDPQQLDQPLQGTHPPGAERSALAHVLDGHATMPPEAGLFLAGTWRLHPEITRYTSEVFYDGRLGSQPGRDVQTVTTESGASALGGSGLRFIAVPHGALNSSESIEEATAIGALIDELLEASPTWTDDKGDISPITPDEILMITPYNAQVHALEEVLGGFRIGTVDKFQGQQAPISIYSMATSSAAEAPRGMEFLYSLNRLNVATSRARCVAVVVASSELLRARCRTPRQMQLANALARLVELASEG